MPAILHSTSRRQSHDPCCPSSDPNSPEPNPDPNPDPHGSGTVGEGGGVVVEGGTG